MINDRQISKNRPKSFSDGVDEQLWTQRSALVLITVLVDSNELATAAVNKRSDRAAFWRERNRVVGVRNVERREPGPRTGFSDGCVHRGGLYRVSRPHWESMGPF